MKILTFLIIAISINAFYHNSTDYFIPKEFDYPEKKIGAGKTFVYENVVTHEQTFEDLKLVNIDGKNCRVLKAYTDSSKFDSSIIFNGETIEIYDFRLLGNGTYIKGEKLQDTIIKGNEKLGTHFTKWEFASSRFIATESLNEVFIKDTIINWHNNNLTCLMIQENGNMNFQPSIDTSVSYKVKFLSNSYYAKEIGLIKYSTDFIDHNGKYNSNTYNLKRIRETQ